MESWNPRFSPLAPFLGSDVHSLNTNRLGIKGSKYSFALSLGACDLLYHHINGQRWVGRTGNFLSTLSAVFSEFDARVRNSIKVIHFAGTRSREDLRILGPILHRHFPNVEELLVTLSASEGSSDANFVLEALASPLPLEDETGWLFPGLTTLRLKARRKAVYDGVMGVIEARRSGGVQAIQRVSIKNGRIGRDAAAKLKATVPDFCMTGTRYIDTESATRGMEPTTEIAITLNNRLGERRRYNDQLPIHRLPPELLCHAFKDGYKEGDYGGLFAIRSVCKRWLEVVDSSPALWTFVSVAHNENLLDMILQKSKNHLLSIEYGTQFGCPRYLARVRSKGNFKKHIIPLAYRWKVLDLRTYGDDFAWALCLQLPNLETLKVHLPVVPCNHSHPLRAPKLRYVTNRGLDLNWESLSDLRVLILANPTSDLSLNQAYAILTNCPRLEIFQAQGNLYSDSRPGFQRSGSTNHPLAPVSLPHLRYLLLFRVAVVPYSALLSLIHAPNLQRLYWLRQLILYWPAPLFKPVERFFGADIHSLNADRLHVRGSRYSFTLSLGACKLVYFSSFPWKWEGERRNYLKELATALSGFDGRVYESIKVIDFGGTRTREDLIVLGPLLHRHFLNVEELMITLSSSERRADAHLVLEALASPLPPEHGAGWLFPELTTLHLKACRQPICDGVLGVIKARQNAEVRAIQRISIKGGTIGRDTAARLEASLQDFRMDGTSYLDTESELA
ncbi:hypothetical protein FRC01_003455 [Tulasnella sp. 417]|nr:hypothetical protein FRC01_003455 [Tulasnella sp. 417]